MPGRYSFEQTRVAPNMWEYAAPALDKAFSGIQSGMKEKQRRTEEDRRMDDTETRTGITERATDEDIAENRRRAVERGWDPGQINPSSSDPYDAAGQRMEAQRAIGGTNDMMDRTPGGLRGDRRTVLPAVPGSAEANANAIGMGAPATPPFSPTGSPNAAFDPFRSADAKMQQLRSSLAKGDYEHKVNVDQAAEIGMQERLKGALQGAGVDAAGAGVLSQSPQAYDRTPGAVNVGRETDRIGDERQARTRSAEIAQSGSEARKTQQQAIDAGRYDRANSGTDPDDKAFGERRTSVLNMMKGHLEEGTAENQYKPRPLGKIHQDLADAIASGIEPEKIMERAKSSKGLSAADLKEIGEVLRDVFDYDEKEKPKQPTARQAGRIQFHPPRMF